VFEYTVLKKQDEIIAGQKHILSLLAKVLKKEKQMSAELDELQAEVTATEGVEQSAVTLIQGIAAQLTALAAQLAAAGIDNAAVLAMRDSLATSTDALAAAVAANPLPPAA
jgi:hypothetical protein